MRLLAVVTLVLGLVLLTGCRSIAEKAAEEAVESATGVQVDQDGDNVSIKTGDGEATISSDAKLPDDFPGDVPIYDNASIESAFTNEVEAGKTFMVAMKSNDDAATKVFPWYKKALEDDGWKINSTMEVGDSVGGLNAEKGSSLLSLAIGYGTDKQADITLTIAPKQ